MTRIAIYLYNMASLHCLSMYGMYIFFCMLDDDQQGVMDNLFEALKNGSAFAVNRKDGSRKRRQHSVGGVFSFSVCCSLQLLVNL